MSVPYSQRWRLLATFNGGFTYIDGHNGSSINGLSYEPLKDGLATLIGYRDGRVDIKTWTGGPNAGPTVAFARQSLPLIIDDGRLNPFASGVRASVSTDAATSSTPPPTTRR
jgi:hypothetical protein